METSLEKHKESMTLFKATAANWVIPFLYGSCRNLNKLYTFFIGTPTQKPGAFLHI